MKLTLPMKLSGLCASGIFILTAIPGYFQLVRPTDLSALASEPVSGITLVENLLFSLGGAFVGSILGFFMGRIMENPQGIPKTNGTSELKTQKGTQSPTGESVTGDETFLSDLEGYAPALAEVESEPTEKDSAAAPGDSVILTEYAEEPSQS